LKESNNNFAVVDVNCENTKKELAAYQKTQVEELLVLAGTIQA